MIRLIRLGIPVLISLFVLACAHTPQEETSDVTWHPESGVRSLMQDVSINISRYPDGSLHTVVVDGVGAHQRQAVEWSVRWFDPAGRQVKGISDRYRRATIVPGVSFNLEAVAPIDYASRAQIHVRRSTTS